MNAPYKTILALDFETRWASGPQPWCPDGYTLSKMTTEEYTRSPLFKAFGVCMHELGSSRPVQWYGHDEIPRILSTYDWTKTAVLAHNAMFDVGILSFIYKVNPCFIFDSLSMGRALRGVKVGNSLAKLAADFNLPPKGIALHSTNGLFEITPEIELELADYCKHDVTLCEEIFSRLTINLNPVTGEMGNPYPKSELRLIDMTLRMFTDPQLMLDTDMLEKAADEEELKLQTVLSRAQVTEGQLASAAIFSKLLEEMGGTVPMKKSPTSANLIPALAKNDALFQALLNGDDEDIALLCEARLKVKSTLERTRARRFIDIAGRGPLPVPLLYYGAGTGRFAATGKINLQNLKRGSFLRKAIMAPPGYSLVVGDLSQIEPRVLAWLSGYDYMLEIFRAGGDPYATFGAQMFNIPGLTKESHPLLRQSAKSALLGAGYQLGWSSFAGQLLVGFLGAPPVRYTKADAKMLGVTQADVEKFLNDKNCVKRMNRIQHACTAQELLIHCLATKAIIDKYRTAAAPVGGFWKILQELIERSLFGGEEYTYKCLTFKKEEIVLANGMSLLYPDLRITHQLDADGEDSTGYTYLSDAKSGKRTKLYAGKVCNNVTQGTARIVMTDGMLRTVKRYPVKGTAHDEEIVLVPDEEVSVARAWVREQMVKEPKWMPNIPLAADVTVAKRYGDAK